MLVKTSVKQSLLVGAVMFGSIVGAGFASGKEVWFYFAQFGWVCFPLIALAGLAPTCGFVAKMYIFSAVARSGFIFLPFLITALLASVILIYGYWRIIRAMFRRIETDIVIDTSVISSKFILYACAAATVIICLFADKLIRFCQLVAYYM